MEVLADPGSLVDHGHPLDLLVETGVLDRDPGVKRERLDEPLVVDRELAGAALVRQVEVAHRGALDLDRHAEERAHRRMVRRESRGVGVPGDVGNPIAAVLADDQAEQAVAPRQRSDAAALLRA